ncbi:hypothetical protein EJV46_11765 [Roseococcus sp. SYP-B2431]|uniref:hypothetical protein n=1 Tax=Roseococcus sp. SYP-B2431 TaxID=2496640 RepID=UPI00103D4F9C|nr:hypothetical protein [Roseococcus sp. SYP-B2431]TCH97894.1 hypothetical protein EJV46_11765 [Roseococcus sp. SYP-B2431]
MQRTCQALQAMVASLGALDSVLLRLQRMDPSPDGPTELLSGTRATVSRVIALLRREGPPLLFRAQALRLRLRPQGYASASPAAAAIRMLHADLDALAAFRTEDAPHWGFIIRRLRSNTMLLLAEFDRHRGGMGPQPAPPSLGAPAPLAVAG